MASRLVLVLLLTLSLVSFEQRHAHAYLDAATTSMVLQFLVGGFFAGLFALAMFWKKVKTAFARFVLRRPPVVQSSPESEGDG